MAATRRQTTVSSLACSTASESDVGNKQIATVNFVYILRYSEKHNNSLIGSGPISMGVLMKFPNWVKAAGNNERSGAISGAAQRAFGTVAATRRGCSFAMDCGPSDTSHPREGAGQNAFHQNNTGRLAFRKTRIKTPFFPLVRRRKEDAVYTWPGVAVVCDCDKALLIELKASMCAERVHTPLCMRLATALMQRERRASKAWQWARSPAVLDALELLAAVLRTQNVSALKGPAWPAILLIEPVLHADATLRASRKAVRLLSGIQNDMLLVRVWQEPACRDAMLRDGSDALRYIFGGPIATPAPTTGAYLVLRKAVYIAQSLAKDVAERCLGLSGEVSCMALRLLNASLAPSKGCPPGLDVLCESSLAVLIACTIYAAGKLCCAYVPFATVIASLQAERARLAGVACARDTSWYRAVGRGDLLAYYNERYLLLMRNTMYRSVGRDSALMSSAGPAANIDPVIEEFGNNAVVGSYVAPQIFVRVLPRHPPAASRAMPRASRIFGAYGGLVEASELDARTD